MGRRKRPSLEPTDFRKVSELVHKRRTERARNSEVLRENPEVANAAVRTYRPEQRLRSVDMEAQRLVRNARGIPRMWDRESPLPPSGSISPTDRLIYLSYGLHLCVSVLLTASALDARSDSRGPNFQMMASLALMSAVSLGVVSISYFRKLSVMAWVGLTVAFFQVVVLLAILTA